MAVYQGSKGIYKVPFIGGLFDDRQEEAALGLEEAYKRAADTYRRLQGTSGTNDLQVGPSAFDQEMFDTQSADTQRRIIDELMKRAESGQIDPQTRARLEAIQQQVADRARQDRQAILSQAMQRGGNAGVTSGETLAALLGAGQNASNAGRLAGVQAAGDADQRALEAYLSAGGLAGQARGQTFQERSAKAAAKDAIDRYNSQMRNQQFQNKFGLTSAEANARTGGAQSGYNATIQSQARDASTRGGLESIIGTTAGLLMGGVPGLVAAGASALPSAMATKNAPQKVVANAQPNSLNYADYENYLRGL